MEIEQLNHIAVEVINSDHGAFLKAMAGAWIRADPENREILKEAWERLIKKYRLDEEFP